MRCLLIILGGALCMSPGCGRSPSSRPDAHEWFVFVSEDLSAPDHQRFGDELALFAGHLADPGDVIHVFSGSGQLASFSIAVTGDPGAERFADLDSMHEVRGAAEYFNSLVHLEELVSCGVDDEWIEFALRQQRATDLPPRVVLVGSLRRHWYVDNGCDCPHAPHSLLNEVFNERFHPEYSVPTRAELDFGRLY